MMQNNESNHKFTKFLKTKGYYMLLCLCLVAAGVSGYVFLSGMMEENRVVEQSLSTPAVTSPQQEQKTEQAQTPTREQEDTKPASAEVEETQTPAPVFEQTIMPVSGTVVQDHAMDRLAYNATTRDWRVHNGVDLAAPLGQQVRAARSGTVSAVYEDDYLGQTVVIRHANGYTSHYCNLSQELTVAAGDVVTAGQTLGTIGATALLEVADEPHLHFEVYHNGEPVDPAGFLY